MTLLRQTQKRLSRDSICNAITLTSDEYKTLYAEVKREIRERAILYQSLQTTTAKEHIRQIARVVALRQNSPLQSTKLRTIQSATLPSLSQETILQSNSQDSATSTYQHKLKQNTAGTQKRWTRELVQPKHEIRGSENSAPASPLVYSDHALQECSLLNICSDLQTHIIRQARIEVTAVYALNHLKLQVLKLSKLLQDFVYLRQNPRNITCVALDKFQFLSANIIALIGTVLYNAIKEYHDDRTRKTIYFHSYTIETIHANYIENSRSNVTMPDDYHNNNVDNILIKCTDNKQQRYNTLIEDYNRAEKREDNILTIDKCRTSHSNKEDIEADEREEETRVRLRESSGEIHNILLREFRGADDFTESMTHNDDEQDEFAILAEEYTIDNCIIHALLEDCDALVERYEEEINCSDLYSTV
ncbi:hypothetical protein HBI21_030760 [Parastagonospora nodorum]|nr:hypothetical protein HBI21_030760 [Parastagonospora nodorum]